MKKKKKTPPRASRALSSGKAHHLLTCDTSLGMAVQGHHLVAFIAKLYFPNLPLWQLMKYSMFSDTLACIFLWLGVEGVVFAPDWLGGKGEANITEAEIVKIAEWKDNGEWLNGTKNIFGVVQDPTRGQIVDGEVWDGFQGAGPVYFDVVYSHAAMFIALFALPFCAYHGLIERRQWREVLCVWLVFVSHPMVDIVFRERISPSALSM